MTMVKLAFMRNPGGRLGNGPITIERQSFVMMGFVLMTTMMGSCVCPSVHCPTATGGVPVKRIIQIVCKYR